MKEDRTQENNLRKHTFFFGCGAGVPDQLGTLRVDCSCFSQKMRIWGYKVNLGGPVCEECGCGKSSLAMGGGGPGRSDRRYGVFGN